LFENVIVSIFCLFFGPNFVLQTASSFPPFGFFSREISRFFFFFASDSTSLFFFLTTRKDAKDRNESFLFFQRALEQARVSLLF